MKIKRIYFFIILLAVSGLILSLFLIPNFEQVSLMLFYDKQHRAARERYNILFQENQRIPRSLVMPLVELNLSAANEEEAIQILEAFVEQNPRSADAVEYLGQLYKDAGKPYHYLLNLERLYRLKPSFDILLQLEELYYTYEDVPNEIRILQTIVDHHETIEEEFYRLIELYAMQGEMQNALATIQAMFKRLPPIYLSSATVSFALHLLLRNHQDALAYQYASQYLSKHFELIDGLDILEPFVYYKQYPEILHIAQMLPIKIQENPQIVGLVVYGLTAISHDDQAYALLKDRYIQKGILSFNSYLINNLLELALNIGDREMIGHVLSQLDPNKISESVLLRIAIQSIEQNDQLLFEILTKDISPAYLLDHPFLAFILNNAKIEHQEEAEIALQTFLQEHQLSNRQKIILAQLYINRQYNRLGRYMLESVDSLADISTDEIYQIAALYARMHLIDKGLTLVLKEENDRPGPNIILAKLILKAARGQVQEIIDWIQSQEQLSEHFLTDLYYTSADNQQGYLAVYISERLFKQDPTSKHLKMMAEAFLINHEYEASARIFKQLYEEGEDVLNEYIDVLAKLSKKNPEYRPLLAKMILTQISTQTISEKRLRELAYLLIEFQFKQEAIRIFYYLAGNKPFKNEDVQSLLSLFGEKPDAEEITWIEKRAAASHGDEKGLWLKHLVDIGQSKKAITLVSKDELKNKAIWKAYYDALTNVIDVLAQATKKNLSYRFELRKYIVAQLNLGPLPIRRLRELGYVLIDAKFKKDAEKIFLKLADDHSFDHEDVQALLGLWGDKPPHYALEWIEQRAKKVSGNEKAKWLKHLLDINQSALVVAIVSKDDFKVDKILDVLLDALANLKQRERIGEILQELMIEENRPKRLKEFAKKAQENNQNDVAELIYRKVLEFIPSDKESLRELGFLLFAKGSYNASKEYLSAYFLQHKGDDYKGNYLYGEILRFQKRYKDSRPYLYTALFQISGLTKQDNESQSTKAQILYRLGYAEQALEIYREMYQKDTKNLFLKAEFANFLIDIEHYQEAATLLDQEDSPLGKNEDVQQRKEAQFQLDLAYIRLLKSLNRICEALCFAKQLLEQYPQSPELFVIIADIHNALGRWQSGLAALAIARELKPENEAYLRSTRDTIRDYLPFFLFGKEDRYTGHFQQEFFTRFRYEDNIKWSNRIRLFTERDHLLAENYVDSKGNIRNFDGERSRGDLSLTHYFQSGSFLTGSFYFAQSILGLGIEASFVDCEGRWVFIGEYHQPNWEFVQTIIEYGSKDRLRVFRTLKLKPRLEIGFGLGANRYNLQTIPGVALSNTIEGIVSYNFSSQNGVIKLLGEESTMNFSYLLDAEYVTEEEIRIDRLGLPFRPLPLDSRENHNFLLTMTKRLNPYLFLECIYGYQYNRLATKILDVPNQMFNKLLVPIYSINIFFGRKEKTEIHLEYSHYPNTVGPGDVDRYLIEMRSAF